MHERHIASAIERHFEAADSPINEMRFPIVFTLFDRAVHRFGPQRFG
jgi:hypothetical protein